MCALEKYDFILETRNISASKVNPNKAVSKSSRNIFIYEEKESNNSNFDADNEDEEETKYQRTNFHNVHENLDWKELECKTYIYLNYKCLCSICFKIISMNRPFNFIKKII